MTEANPTAQEGYLAKGARYEVRDRHKEVIGNFEYIGHDGHFYIFRETIGVREFENSVSVPGARYRRINMHDIGEINDAKPDGVWWDT